MGINKGGNRDFVPMQVADEERHRMSGGNAATTRKMPIWQQVTGLLALSCLCVALLRVVTSVPPGPYLSTIMPSILSTGNSRACSYDTRVRRILAKYPLIDGHNDLAILIREVYKNHLTDDFHHRFEHGNLAGHVDKPRIKDGHYGGAFWSAFYTCPGNISDFSDRAYNPSRNVPTPASIPADTVQSFAPPWNSLTSTSVYS